MRSSPQALDRTFVSIAALLFLISAAVTIAWCRSMSSMPAMLMPGGWTMTMTWMRMPGQTWLSGATSFLSMWTVMMVAMMLPSIVPTLWRARTALGILTVLAAAGYFCVWLAVGVAIYPIGMLVAAIAMRQPSFSRAVPVTTAAVLIIAILLQFSAWKAERLACCREASARAPMLPLTLSAAWRHGVHLGYDCVRCCGNLMTILLALGVMDLRVMAIVTAAITFERLGPRAQLQSGLAARTASIS